MPSERYLKEKAEYRAESLAKCPDTFKPCEECSDPYGCFRRGCPTVNRLREKIDRRFYLLGFFSPLIQIPLLDSILESTPDVVMKEP